MDSAYVAPLGTPLLEPAGRMKAAVSKGYPGLA
jgi:hypothetical protein